MGLTDTDRLCISIYNEVAYDPKVWTTLYIGLELRNPNGRLGQVFHATVSWA